MRYSLAMRKIYIFQIFYNEQTKNSLDPGFLPLDNIDNVRADWREYWPIRKYLLSNQLDENSVYGFFSPKFKKKTGLSADECFKFIDGHTTDVDVFSFSPFFDLGAFYKNSFFQAINQCPNSRYAMEGALKIIDPALDLNELIMHSGNNIFCNYFVAKPVFWRAWLANCELIWAECEENTSLIAKGLNEVDSSHDSPALIKTFLIERMASLMLATNSVWNVEAFNPFMLPLSSSLISGEPIPLIEMDALKIAYASQKRVEYLNLFHYIQNSLIKNIGQL